MFFFYFLLLLHFYILTARPLHRLEGPGVSRPRPTVVMLPTKMYVDKLNFS